ncbi:hypothetical protein CR513_22880, partial [Mucuna pruriens]
MTRGSAWERAILFPNAPNRRSMVLRENRDMDSESFQKDTSSSSGREFSSEGSHYEGNLLMLTKRVNSFCRSNLESSWQSQPRLKASRPDEVVPTRGVPLLVNFVSNSQLWFAWPTPHRGFACRLQPVNSIFLMSTPSFACRL